MTATVGWPLLLAVFLVPDAQLEAEAQVKRLGWMCGCPLLFQLHVNKKMREKNKLETLINHFAKLGGHKLPWIKVPALVTKL